MLWFICFAICIALVVVGFMLQHKYPDFEFVQWLTAGSAVVGMLFFVVILGTSPAIFVSKIDYEKSVQQRKDLVTQGKMIAAENGAAVEQWYTNAKEFNYSLVSEQSTIKYCGNMFSFHDKRYLDLETIDIDKYVINAPAYKFILDNEQGERK